MARSSSPAAEAFSANTPHQLGDALRAYRKGAGLTQAAAGQKGGLLQKTVSMLETDPLRVSVDSLYRLLSALNVELLVRDRAPPPKSGDW